MIRRSLLRRPPATAPLSPRTPFFLRSYATEPIPVPPKIPPAPPKPDSETQSSDSKPADIPPPPHPPPKKPRRIFRRTLYATTTLIALFYAGGTYYALKNDNFHDFFTEFVPFGEECVLFWEEREFQRRFGVGSIANQRKATSDKDAQVTVSGKSGVSARVAGKGEDKKGGKPEVQRETEVTSKGSKAVSATEERLGEKDRAIAQPSNPAAKPDEKKSPEPRQPERKPASQSKSAPSAQQPPSQPKQPISPVETLNLSNASDATVQATAKILNDLIAVINASPSPTQYAAPIAKAKDDLNSLASSLSAHHSAEAAAANDKIRQRETEFDNAAKALYERVQRDQRDQEITFREEYEAERERLASSYQEKLRAEAESLSIVAEQKLKNELLQQSVQLNEQFTESVRRRVETERAARLSRLNELSASVADLAGLTARWGAVIDANVRTQHMVVAVEAVRSALETPEHRPKPFLHELAALKEVASDNPVINAAIASIHPSAYRVGVPTGAQLVDRFRRVAEEVRKASLLPEDAGVASQAASLVMSKMLFRKDKGGLATGGDVESVLSRTEMLLEEGDLDGAAREVNGLEGWPRVLSRDWLGECRRVLEVRQAVDVSSSLYFMLLPLYIQHCGRGESSNESANSLLWCNQVMATEARLQSLLMQ